MKSMQTAETQTVWGHFTKCCCWLFCIVAPGLLCFCVLIGVLAYEDSEDFVRFSNSPLPLSVYLAVKRRLRDKAAAYISLIWTSMLRNAAFNAMYALFKYVFMCLLLQIPSCVREETDAMFESHLLLSGVWTNFWLLLSGNTILHSEHSDPPSLPLFKALWFYSSMARRQFGSFKNVNDFMAVSGGVGLRTTHPCGQYCDVVRKIIWKQKYIWDILSVDK